MYCGSVMSYVDWRQCDRVVRSEDLNFGDRVQDDYRSKFSNLSNWKKEA